MFFGFLRLIHVWLRVAMAYNDKQPFLSGSQDAKSSNKRRFLHVKSPLLSKLVSSEINRDHLSAKYPPLYESIKKLVLFLAIYLAVGTSCFYIVRDDIRGKKTNDIIDALYLCITTMTTVGYGDLVPEASLAKFIATILAFVGMGIVGLIMSKAADYILQKQEIFLLKALQKYHKLGPEEILKETETNVAEFKLALVSGILVVLMSVGTIFLVAVEDMDFIDAFYAASSTMTTLGYGDKSFSSKSGRLFAVFWILTSTVGIGQLFVFVTEFLSEDRQRAMLNWVIAKKSVSLDLEAADGEEAGVFAIAEFVIYKLREMGKISEEDISVAMKDFEDVGIDVHGDLSAEVAKSTETKK